MFGQNATSDKELLKNVNRRLQRSGSQAGITASVQNGTVTISGKLRAEDQRLTIVRALRSVNGVRNVIDQLQAPPKKQLQRYQPTSPAASAAVAVPSESLDAPPSVEVADGVSGVLPIPLAVGGVVPGDILPSAE
jgi:hypothetical protein